MALNIYEYYDRDLCACGCKTKVPYEGLEPRFASAACRGRWVEKWAIGPREPETTELDARPQTPPPPVEPVPAEEVAEVQAEFAQRVTVAPLADAVLTPPPSGMLVRSRPGALLKFLLRTARKVR